MVKEAQMKESLLRLSVRAQHVLAQISPNLTLGQLESLTPEKLFSTKNSGTKTVSEIMDFRKQCIDGDPDPTFPDEIPHADEHLPDEAVALLSKRVRNVLEKNDVLLTPQAICSLNSEMIADMKGAGKTVIRELMDFRSRCRDGSVWQVKRTTRDVDCINPGEFNSLSEYILAVLSRLCKVSVQYEIVMRMNMGLLNVRTVKTLDATGKHMGNVTRERVRQIAAKLTNLIGSDAGKAMFADFIKTCEHIFKSNNSVLLEEKLTRSVEMAYPRWTGTTAFSICQLIKCVGIPLETNESKCVAWMSGGVVESRYHIFVQVISDPKVLLAHVSEKYMLKHSVAFGLAGLTADEYAFYAHRAFCLRQKRERPRWDLFLRLRCSGMRVGAAERRRYAVARVLSRAGVKGLSCPEIVSACAEIDPTLDPPSEKLLNADADPKQKYDMDGAGTHLIEYDYAEVGRPKRYTLDIYFRNKEVEEFLDDFGTKLRIWMEDHAVGVMSVHKLRVEMEKKNSFPAAFGGELPSACLYSLLRDRRAGGLIYYDHPNVAHPKIAGKNSKVPEKAMGWVIYDYFNYIDRELVTAAQLSDFCTKIMGVEPKCIANVMIWVKGDTYKINDKVYYSLVPPCGGIAMPKMLCSDKVDFELSFSKDRTVGKDNVDKSGRPLSVNAYVRLFLRRLVKSRYSFTDEDRTNLANGRWCGRNFGISAPVFVASHSGAQIPSLGYWREQFNIGGKKYWVYGRWSDKNKGRFDSWAKRMSQCAGFEFVPYEIQLSTKER